jgi:hypothetical protein
MTMRLHRGPADGFQLHIVRTPLLLRVTKTDAGAVDCLNEITDEAMPEEALSVYRLRGNPGRGFMCRRGSGGGCTPTADGDYDYLGPPSWFGGIPPDETLRNNTLWAEWCDANRERLMPAWAKGKGAK